LSSSSCACFGVLRGTLKVVGAGFGAAWALSPCAAAGSAAIMLRRPARSTAVRPNRIGVIVYLAQSSWNGIEPGAIVESTATQVFALDQSRGLRFVTE
jgi:hypothetical protein